MEDRCGDAENRAPVVDAAARLSVLGGFELTWQGVPVPLSATAQRLLAFLAVQLRPMQRSYVASLLWADTTEARAGASLRTALWQVRRSGCPTVAVSGGKLCLSGLLSTDVEEFVGWARRVIGRTPTTADLEPDSPAFYGEFLPGAYDEWAATQREQLRQLRLHALDVLCEHLTAGGHTALAVEVGLTAVGLEPLRESSQRALLSAYVAEGNRSEAVRQYGVFSELLRAELGTRPSPDTEALVREALVPATS